MDIAPRYTQIRSNTVRLALAGLLAGGCAAIRARASAPAADDIAGCYRLAYEPWTPPPGHRGVTPTDSLPSLLEPRADRLQGRPHFDAAGERPFVARARYRDGRESTHFRSCSLPARDSVFISVALPFGGVDLHLRWNGGAPRGRIRGSSDHVVLGSSSAAVSGRRVPCEGSG